MDDKALGSVARFFWDGIVELIVFSLAIATGLGFAITRFAGVTRPSFQAAVHIYVGILIGGIFFHRDYYMRWRLFYVAIAMSLIELAAFVLKIGR